MFELDDLPTVITDISNILNDILKFVNNVNDKKFTPFCVPMQFWMNPKSILTGEYLPKELILMAGITEEPEPNQKGELMCKMLLDRSVANCGIRFEQNFNSIGADTNKLKKGISEPVEPLMAPTMPITSSAPSTPSSTSLLTSSSAPSTPSSSAPSTPSSSAPSTPSSAQLGILVKTKPSVGQKISNFFRSKKVAPTFGGGLKSHKLTDTQPIMPRIYRPTQQRRTDYYNYL